MDVSKIPAEKKVLESAIAALIANFEINTGVQVASLQLARERQSWSDRHIESLSYVVIKLTLPGE